MDTDAPFAFPPPSAPVPTAPVLPATLDAATQARLARLSSSRAPRLQPAPTGRTTPAADRQPKRHPAKGSRAAAVLMSVAATAGLTAYFQHVDSAAASTAAGSTAITTAAGTTGASTTAATTGATSALADGTYAGATATNRWGPVQVQITVVGGKITDVVALQTPTGGKSDSINARATPRLATEVLSAQSAKIDTVSGATYTSKSYKASLQSAIDLAHTTARQAAASS